MGRVLSPTTVRDHYLKSEGERFDLFEGCQQIIPDYLSLDRKVVADAKYIPLDQERAYGEEKATSIYYKTITYMYRFCSNTGLLLYPHPNEGPKIKELPKVKVLKVKTEMEHVNGGRIVKVGLRIPSNCQDFDSFCSSMKDSELDFVGSCDPSYWQ